MRTVGMLMVAGAMFGMALAPPAHAAPLNKAGVKVYADPLPPIVEETGSGTVSVSGTNYGHQAGQFSFGAGATAGALVADLWSQMCQGCNTGLNFRRVSYASSVMDDFVISGPAGNVQYFVNVEVEGTTSIAGAGLNQWVCGETNVRVNGVLGFWSYGEGSSGSPCPYPSSGWLSAVTGPSVSGVYQIGPFTASANVPFDITLSVDAAAHPHQGGDMPGVEGRRTTRVAFAQAVPAIQVPVGYSASSQQANIVNGWYLGTASADRIEAPRVRLAAATPNPFRERTRFSIELPSASHATLTMFDLAGRAVKTLVDGDLPAGTHAALWDGRDASGRAVGAGIYFARLEVGGQSLVQRAVRIER